MNEENAPTNPQEGEKIEDDKKITQDMEFYNGMWRRITDCQITCIENNISLKIFWHSCKT